MLLADDLTQLLDVLPTFISGPLEKHPSREQLVEIVLDIGRRLVLLKEPITFLTVRLFGKISITY